MKLSKIGSLTASSTHKWRLKNAKTSMLAGKTQ